MRVTFAGLCETVENKIHHKQKAPSFESDNSSCKQLQLQLRLQPKHPPPSTSTPIPTPLRTTVTREMNFMKNVSLTSYEMS